MNEENPSAPSDKRANEQEVPAALRNRSVGAGGVRLSGKRESRQPAPETKRVEIVLRLAPVEATEGETQKSTVEVTSEPVSPPPAPSQQVELPTPTPSEVPAP